MKIKFVIEKGSVGADNYAVDVKSIDISKKRYPVTLNFNSSEIIGLAEVTNENGTLYAECEIDEKYINLTPAIGFSCQTPTKLINIGLCSNPNSDESILSINEQIKIKD